jgi:DegV family protein with EDD domain
MSDSIILSADSTCDLGDELKARHHVHYFPLHITLGERLYADNIDITPPEIFAIYRQTGELPKTSAVNITEYLKHFERWTREGKTVIHLNLGSALSSSYEHALIAAQQANKRACGQGGKVYVIDSGNLSTGMGLLVIAAAERIVRGLSAQRVVAEVEALKPFTHASFVIDTLEFLHAGGRCTTLQAVVSSMLSIKPAIEVNNHDGSMRVGKKYHGKFSKVLLQYVQDQLDRYEGKIDFTRVFITTAAATEADVEAVYDYLKNHACFKEIHLTTASCTISSHCGPNTLGVLFMTR